MLMAGRQRVVTYDAPVLCVDMAAEGYEIWPCDECLPWHLEVFVDDDGVVTARAWHAADCPMLEELLLEGDAPEVVD